MVQLTQKRVALLLYAILLILPTAVLGGLQWRQIDNDLQQERAAVPSRAHEAGKRLIEALRERVTRFVDSEQARPLTHYAPVYTPEGTTGSELQLLPSPLVQIPLPPGIQAWFAYDVFEQAGPPGQLLMCGSATEELAVASERRDWLASEVRGIFERNKKENPYSRAARLGKIRDVDNELLCVAVLCSWADERECLRNCLPWMRDRRIRVTISQFQLQCQRGVDGQPLFFATRRLFTPNLLDDLPAEAHCLRPLVAGLAITQGFLIDQDWLLGRLPEQMAAQVLGTSERLELGAHASSDAQASFDLLHELGIELDASLEPALGRMAIRIDTASMEERYATQRLRFLGLAVMLVVSLSTGLISLWRSVTQQIEQVRRMENFVAAVTHELRTPLSAIRLHGEMLLDGWATQPEQQQEYYRRIVRETGRLSALVERVLEKSRLTSGTAQAKPGDLNLEIERTRPALALSAPPRADVAQVADESWDVAFYLDEDLPQVLLTAEAVSTMLINLVENARKYAPVDPTRAGWEPIRVATRREGQSVLLEVADRGPGIPPEEAEKVFEAFYRIGNEATRTATGTGLGLHLCWLHARSLGGEISVHAREGGGAVFRVRFETAT